MVEAPRICLIGVSPGNHLKHPLTAAHMRAEIRSLPWPNSTLVANERPSPSVDRPATSRSVSGPPCCWALLPGAGHTRATTRPHDGDDTMRIDASDEGGPTISVRRDEFCQPQTEADAHGDGIVRTRKQHVMSALQFVPPLADAHSAVAAAGSSSAVPPPTLEQWWSDVAAQLKTLQPNRQIFIDVDTVAKPAAASAAKGKAASSAPAVPSAAPRYSLWVLDAELDASVVAGHARKGCKAAVLVLPQGRESEWQFRSASGGNEIARQHGFARVIFVALNRGHAFADLAAVQAELGPLLRQLSPSSPPLEAPMPVVSLGPDVGARRSVAREVSAGGAGEGSVLVEVEDVLVGEHVHRRMLFGIGGGLVQSEARLNVPTSFLTMTTAQRKAKAKKKKQQAAKKAAAAAAATTGFAAMEEKDADEVGADEVEDAEDGGAAASTVASSASASITAPSPSAALIRYDYLPCEYQHGLLALLAIWRGTETASAASTGPSLPAAHGPRRCVLVGLGGGSLAMFLHRAFPRLQLDVVELDPSVVRSAWRYFGFQERPPALRVHVGDGVEFVHELARRIIAHPTEELVKQMEQHLAANTPLTQADTTLPGGVGSSKAAASIAADVAASYAPPTPGLSASPTSSSFSSSSSLPCDPQDVLIIDVNNSDLSAGLSFPPEGFLSPEFLRSARACLVPHQGVLLVNLACRNTALREELLCRLADVFHAVYTLRPDEQHVNVVVAATDATWDDETHVSETDGTATPVAVEAEVATSSTTRRMPALSWTETMVRLQTLQQQCHPSGSVPSFSSSFRWSDEMELKPMLGRLQFIELRNQDGEAPSGVNLHAVFPRQMAAQEAEK